MRFTTRSLILVAAGFVAGLLIGLLLLGWTLWPVKWTDADPWDLRPQSRDAYIAAVADSLASNGNADLARERLARWDRADLTAAIQRIAGDARRSGAALQAQNLDELNRALSAPTASAPPAQATQARPASATGTAAAQPTALRQAQPPAAVPTTPAQAKAPSPVRWLPILAVSALGVLAVLAGVGWYSRRSAGARAEPIAEGPAPTPRGAAPIGSFEASYRAGESKYEETFDIAGPTGQLLGDCGLAVAHSLDEEGTRVAAFETWLYDKAGVQTVTRVFMSDHAFQDAVIRAKLAARGEAIQAQQGAATVLETQNLTLQVAIREASYDARPPARGCFERFAVRIQAFVKEVPLGSASPLNV